MRFDLRSPSPCPVQYHMMTMRNTRYSMSQVFIERFDLDLVTINSTDKLPPWYRNHLTMLVRYIYIYSSMRVWRHPDTTVRAVGCFVLFHESIHAVLINIFLLYIPTPVFSPQKLNCYLLCSAMSYDCSQDNRGTGLHITKYTQCHDSHNPPLS